MGVPLSLCLKFDRNNKMSPLFKTWVKSACMMITCDLLSVGDDNCFPPEQETSRGHMLSYSLNLLITRCCSCSIKVCHYFTLFHFLLALCTLGKLSLKVICTSFNCLIMEIPVSREFTFEWPSVKSREISSPYFPFWIANNSSCLWIFLLLFIPPHGSGGRNQCSRLLLLYYCPGD